MRPAPGGRALRLTFRYDGDRVELVSSQRVDMTLPPSHPVDPAENEPGFWFTVWDDEERPLYRRAMPSPVRSDVEVFSPAATQNIQRVPLRRPRGTFVLLVPDVEAAATLTLHLPSTEPGAQTLPAREWARFDLRAQNQTEG